MNRLSLILAILLAVLGAAMPAAGQNIAVTRTPVGNAPVLGSMMVSSSANTFSVSTAGVVVKTGPGIRMTTPAVTAPLVTVTCSGSVVLCLARGIRITIVPVTNTGSASITNLRIGGLANSAFLLFPPTAAPSLSFDLLAIGSSISFTVGMDVLVAANATPGLNTFSYTVTATFL